ncbi:hypothetical protein EMIHUDRAFT_225268 [Emiliania huxleyi CCMP1516]|uniref:Chaperone DnaJ C-terminal domain-containing protein n=2 Tax=Emiliania huxleyi TaxID=2903 RepID=A0A0D3KPK1_EMIH1|nr:hypothetical protein EMIHUDRAFT_225268 [Emiliania huxleyi CCMP1516]EOD37686.1 hypothetical protein EMIHUDRAFT_225268 [Emiliania huxleyi CCMP1516]|eukprot:XP_005790115.1 hypothetical protein EMIHUDRAFT_225268 [Emiliania huxleyi CCMP1516]
MQITLPAGAAAGTPVHVATSSGGEFEIVVPEGCGPGQPRNRFDPALGGGAVSLVSCLIRPSWPSAFF